MIKQQFILFINTHKCKNTKYLMDIVMHIFPQYIAKQTEVKHSKRFSLLLSCDFLANVLCQRRDECFVFLPTINVNSWVFEGCQMFIYYKGPKLMEY